MAHTCHPSTGKAETGGSLGFLWSVNVSDGWAPDRWKTQPRQKARWVVPEERYLRLSSGPRTHICAHTRTCVHTMDTYICKCPRKRTEGKKERNSKESETPWTFATGFLSPHPQLLTPCDPPVAGLLCSSWEHSHVVLSQSGSNRRLSSLCHR